MKSKAIFQLALNLTEPWFVSDINLKEKSGKKELHVTIDYQSGHFIGSDYEEFGS